MIWTPGYIELEFLKFDINHTYICMYKCTYNKRLALVINSVGAFWASFKEVKASYTQYPSDCTWRHAFIWGHHPEMINNQEGRLLGNWFQGQFFITTCWISVPGFCCPLPPLLVVKFEQGAYFMFPVSEMRDLGSVHWENVHKVMPGTFQKLSKQDLEYY